MDLVKAWAKTLAAFVAGVVTTMILNLVNGGAVWPQTRAEWLQYVLTSFGAAIAVALTRNKITQKQLDKDPNVIGGTVVPDAQVPPAAPPVGGVYRNPWKP
jgi:hypothetical protein